MAYALKTKAHLRGIYVLSQHGFNIKREFTIEGMTGYTFVAIRGEDGGAYKLKGDIVQKLLGKTASVPNLISTPR